MRALSISQSNLHIFFTRESSESFQEHLVAFALLEEGDVGARVFFWGGNAFRRTVRIDNIFTIVQPIPHLILVDRTRRLNERLIAKACSDEGVR